jgi:hypothetical protein
MISSTHPKWNSENIDIVGVKFRHWNEMSSCLNCFLACHSNKWLKWTLLWNIYSRPSHNRMDFYTYHSHSAHTGRDDGDQPPFPSAYHISTQWFPDHSAHQKRNGENLQAWFYIKQLNHSFLQEKLAVNILKLKSKSWGFALPAIIKLPYELTADTKLTIM